MDRSREGRRLNAISTVSSNLLSKRRRRGSIPEEKPETVQKLRDRRVKKKRRRGEEGEETIEYDSVGGNEDDYEEDVTLNATSSSSAVINHRSSLPPLPPGEMIRVSVPRKARSVSVKRTHESWVNGPSSSLNLSVRKKMGPKIRVTKVLKPSSLVQEDIEIEVAEVLYCLKKQSRSQIYVKDDTTEKEAIDGDGVVSLSTSSFDQNGNDNVGSETKHGLESNNGRREDKSVTLREISMSHGVNGEIEQNGKLEIACPELGNALGGNAESGEVCKAETELPAVKEMEVKGGDQKLAMKESSFLAKEKSVSTVEESATFTKLDVDSQITSIALEVVSEKKEKLTIDLMAPPPPPPVLSYQQKELSSDIRLTVCNKELSENKVKDEVKNDKMELQEKSIKAIAPKHELTHDLEKLNFNHGNGNNSKLQKKQHSKATGSKIDPTVQNISMPLPIHVTGWPTGLPPRSYMPPLQTVMATGRNAGGPPLRQPPSFLPHHRPKRCATHHYIACKIRMHQQRTNQFWPATAGSVVFSGAKANYPNTKSEGFPVVNLSAANDKLQAVANFSVATGKLGSSKCASLIDGTPKKQFVINQSPQPAPASNLQTGSFTLNVGQHHTPVAPTRDQFGSSKNVFNASSSVDSVAKVAKMSSSFPTVSFNYPNLAPNEAPFIAILPNNGYPFHLSRNGTHNPQAFRGGTPVQALPYCGGPFYPAPFFHPSIQQQQPHCQSLIHPIYQKSTTSSDSSSSHRQPENQKPQSVHVSESNFLTPITVESQQPRRQHVPSNQSWKLETEVRDGTSMVSDTQPSCAPKSVHGEKQNAVVPLQTNFKSISSSNIAIGSNSNKQQPQQTRELNPKSGVRVPSQTFTMAFTSLNGKNACSNIKFSSMVQDPSALQNLSNTGQGYQVTAASEAAKRNNQLLEGKSGGSSTNHDNGRKVRLEKLQPILPRTAVSDNSARTGNSVSSPFAGTRHPRSITSSMDAANATTLPNAQQQLKLQYSGVTQIKHQSCSSTISIFSANVGQSNSLAQSSQWKNKPKALASQAP